MRMNGCAMLVLNPPAGAAEAARDAADWVAGHCGDTGARAETRLI
jgi:23S rRNA (adenine2030-N6)-methyltransferase